MKSKKDYDVIEITGDEMDEIYALFDKIDYKCGDDEWYPSEEELRETVEKNYDEITELLGNHTENITQAQTKEYVAILKTLIMYMMWIEETQSGDLGFDVIAYIRDFLTRHLQIIY